MIGGEKQLDTVRQKRILYALRAWGTDQALEDLAVVRFDEGFQYHHDGHQVLVLPPGEPERDVSVFEIVQRVGLRGLIRPHRTYYYSVRCILGAAVGEAGPSDGHGEVPAVYEQEPDDLLDAVDDEVASQLLCLFLSPNKQSWRVVLEMAFVGLEAVSMMSACLASQGGTRLTLIMMGICPTSRTNSSGSPSLIRYSNVAESLPRLETWRSLHSDGN